MITLADETEVNTVKLIFNLADAGKSSREIRQVLVAKGITQKGIRTRKREWTPTLISRLLHSEEYTGKLTWRFADGSEYTLDIPQIITPEQFKRVQQKLANQQKWSKRNTKNIYPLQGLLYCGECGRKIQVNIIMHGYFRLKDGTVKKYERKSPLHCYYCQTPTLDDHPRPYKWTGPALDYSVWRKIADEAIKNPDLIIEQVTNRQAELKAQGDNFDGEIATAERKLNEIETERAFYQRQAARKMITEKEFDARMAETEESRQYWLEQLDHLRELSENSLRVKSSLDYARNLFESIAEILLEIDQSPEELKTLPIEKRNWVLLERQKRIRALADKILVFADGSVEIQGLLDGSEIDLFKKHSTYAMLLLF